MLADNIEIKDKGFSTMTRLKVITAKATSVIG